VLRDEGRQQNRDIDAAQLLLSLTDQRRFRNLFQECPVGGLRLQELVLGLMYLAQFEQRIIDPWGTGKGRDERFQMPLGCRPILAVLRPAGPGEQLLCASSKQPLLPADDQQPDPNDHGDGDSDPKTHLPTHSHPPDRFRRTAHDAAAVRAAVWG
jgi:hypothetical protein